MILSTWIGNWLSKYITYVGDHATVQATSSLENQNQNSEQQVSTENESHMFERNTEHESQKGTEAEDESQMRIEKPTDEGVPFSDIYSVATGS